MARKSVVTDYNRIEKQVWSLSEPLVAACGAELIDVEYVKEAGSWYLRLFIDREPPVDHDLCQQVSEAVGAALDREDPVADSYYLEISSPGVERPLRREQDFTRFAGRQVAVRLYAPRNGVKEFSGQLLGLDQGEILLQTEDGEARFAADQVAKAYLRAEF